MPRSAHPLEGKCILVAEADRALARVIKGDLESAGGLVAGPIPSAKTSMRILGDVLLDGAFVDLALDEGLPIDLLKALRRRRVPFIVISDVALPKLPMEASGAPQLRKALVHRDAVSLAERHFKAR